MSSILLLVVFVLLARLVRSIDRKRHPVVVAQVTARDIMEESHPAFPRDHAPACQRTDMTSNPSPGEPEGAAEPIRDPRPEGVRVPRREGPAPAGRAAASGVRWGRTAIALVGLAGLLGAALTAVLSPFTGIRWPLPVFLVIVGIGALASLRYLALSDREARRAGGTTSRPAAPASASSAPRSATRAGAEGADQASSPAAAQERLSARPEASGRRASARAAAPERQTAAPAPARPAAAPVRSSARSSSAEPDAHRRMPAEAPASGSLRAAPRRLTAAAPQPRLYDRAPQAPAGESAREARRAGLEELRAQAKRSAARPSEAFHAAGSTWDPVEVPKPTYVDAPEAHRERPEPLTPPAEPEAHSKSLEEASRTARPIDLDDVLSRRRA
jgi:hypothetical protein